MALHWSRPLEYECMSWVQLVTGYHVGFSHDHRNRELQHSKTFVPRFVLERGSRILLGWWWLVVCLLTDTHISSISGCLCSLDGTRQERQHVSHNGPVCSFWLQSAPLRRGGTETGGRTRTHIRSCQSAELGDLDFWLTSLQISAAAATE